DSINVTINTIPVVALGADTAVCGGTVTLDAGTTVDGSYLWSDNTTAPILIAVASGNYSVVVTDTLTGCMSSDSINVTINTLPTVTFSMATDTICEQDADLVLTGSPVAGTFSGPGVTGSNFDPSSLNGPQTIVYTFTDTNGCVGTASDNIVVDPCTGINDNNSVIFGMSVYPNPNYGKFNIELNYVPVNDVTVEITNTLGQVVATYVMNTTLLEVNIGMYEGGIYNVKVTDGQTTYVGRIVKE
ncbi:MAG TPA: T9SS type A sorting domain-containing protein, partial [Bacteroidia bacterium]|nr:T9SS type A sorting domain-containing protein [Bacteroidia bacterium]